MNEKLDLIKLLKDCPKGMPLNCTIFDGSVTFNGIVDDDLYPIEIKIDNDYEERLNKYGGYNNSPYCKCVIFPKGKTSWEGFQRPFKDGDVVFSGYKLISIYKKETDNGLCSYVSLSNDTSLFINLNNWTLKNIRLATEEEKEKLFQAIKDNGYKWNSETKTLENLIVPKFKVEDKIHTWTLQDAKEGDVLAINWYEGCDYWEKIVIFKKYHNEGANSPCVEGYGNTFKNGKLAFQEEVPFFSKTWTSCLEPATKEQRDLLFQKIKEAGYKWNPETKTLEKLIEPKFKDGDIVYLDFGHYYKITIFKRQYREFLYYHASLRDNNVLSINTDNSNICTICTSYLKEIRFATEEEKAELFQVIRDNGYKWNADEKKLEKLIEPKFKVGDKIKHKDTILTIITVRTDDYIVEDNPYNFGILMFSHQDNWELINEPKFKVGDRIRYAGEDFPIKIIDIKNNQYHIECFYDKYNDYKNGIIPVSEQNNYMLIPKFNPKTLQPFDRVLVSCNDEWFCDFFSHYDDAVNKFNCTCTGGCPYEYCIPYNDDTKHLIGKSIEDTPEFYRHWEE